MPEKPKVMIVGPVPPPIGGVETQIATLLDSPLRQRFDLVHCDTTKRRPGRVRGRFDFENVRWALRHFRMLSGAIKREQPDVVYLPIISTKTGFMRDSVFVRIINRHRKLAVGHIHGGDFDRLYQAAPKQLQRWIVSTLNRMDVICALGTMWAELFREVGVRSDVRIVPPTTRREVFEAGDAVQRSPEGADGCTILFVGQVGDRKGTFDLIEAATAVRERAPESRMLMVGPDEFAGEWERVTAAIEERGLQDYIELTGSLEGDALLDAYRRGDVMVLPSYYEGFPAVMIEAGAFGQPLVISPAGAIGDYVTEGDNGFLVEAGNVPQITDRLVQLCNDRALRYKMGQRNRDRARAYHPDVIAGQVGDAIQAAFDMPISRRARSKRPKVLIVGPIPPPVGGVESVTRALLESDLRLDFDVRHCDISRKQSKENVSRLTLMNFFWAAIYTGRYMWQVVWQRPRIVHLPVVSMPVPFARDAWMTIYGWLLRRKMVVHSHDGYLPEVYSKASKSYQAWMRFVFNRSACLITISETWYRFFKSWGLTCPMEVVYNPLDENFRLRLQRRQCSNQRPWTALFVGAVCHDKGVDDLLHAAKDVLAKRPDVRFDVVGPGRFPGEWEKAQEMRQELGLADQVSMPGTLLGQALADAYASADCFVLPTYFEGMPVVLVEAMAAGLPVVTTDVGGILDLVEDGVNGYIVKPGDKAGLAERILELAEHPDKARAMREENIAKVEASHLRSSMAAKVKDIYEGLLR